MVISNIYVSSTDISLIISVASERHGFYKSRGTSSSSVIPILDAVVP